MIDDKINLRANTKLTVLLIILTLAIWIDADLQISKINFSFLEEDIELKRFSVLFSLFSIIIFINAINMIDGIDLLAGIYLLFLILLIILRSDIDYLLIFISIGLINFLFLNFKKKFFREIMDQFIVLILLDIYLSNQLNMTMLFMVMKFF